MRPLGKALSAAGFHCHAVRLPGHATTVAELVSVRHRDWIETVESAARDMTAEVPRTALVGMSLGALLALAVASAGRVPVHALVLLGTPLRFADERVALLRLVGWIPGVPRARLVRKRRGRDILDEAARARSLAYDAFPLASVVEMLRLRSAVKRGLHRVTQPTLVLHGRHDRTAPLANVEALRRRLPARPLEVSIFEHSAHVLTEDADRDAVAARVVDFLSRHEQG